MTLRSQKNVIEKKKVAREKTQTRSLILHFGDMAADHEQFNQLLSTLLSTDNDVRTQAEVSKSLILITPLNKTHK